MNCDKISDKLKKMFAERAADISTGRLAVSYSEENDCANVWKTLKDFGGSGWVCHTADPDIMIFSEKETIGKTGGCILSAEAANGNESLHICRNGSKWSLTKVRKEDSEDGIMVKDFFVCTSGGKLNYETAWELRESKCGDVNITEYTPCAYRFVGFTA